MKPVDTMSREEVGTLVNESADKILADTEADATALKVDIDISFAGDQLTIQGHIAVEAVEPGVISADDYANAVQIPSTAPKSSSLFDDIFADLQSAFMTMIGADINISLAATLREALKILDELQALSQTVLSESAKVSLAAAAGLLTPPKREDLETTRDSSRSFKDEIDAAAAELRSAESRRRAARRQAGEEDNSPDGLSAVRPAVGPVPGRVLESGAGGPPPDDSVGLTLTAPRVSLTTSSDSQRSGRAQTGLADSSQSVKDSVLDSIGNIALCTVMSSMDVSDETRKKAAKSLDRLGELVGLLHEATKSTFIIDIGAAIQELAVGPLEALGREVQSRLDLMDKFLEQVSFPLPTFKSTVRIIGEVPDDLVIGNSLLAACGLRMDNFCGGQGMLELSLAVDANLGEIKPRAPQFGRVCLTLLPPAIDPVAELTPELQRPDREAQLILSAPLLSGQGQVTAHFPRQNVTRAITSPVPNIPALIAVSVSPGDTEVRLTIVGSNPLAPVGSLTLEPGQPWSEILRYASFVVDGPQHVFTLIDLPSTVPHGSGLTATATGQHRDTFTGVYQQRSEISGGSGALNVGGEGEHRHRLDYDSSAFDPATGDYVFDLSSTYSGMSHKTQVTGTTADTRKAALYRLDIRQPAERFKTVGSQIQHATNTAFNFGVAVAPGDLLVLSDDENETPVSVVSVDNIGLPTKIMISSAYHNGNVDGVTLVKVPTTTAPGATFFSAKLTARQVEDLRLAALVPGGGSLPLVARGMLDTGESTRRLSRVDGNVWGQVATPARQQRLKSVAAMFQPGDVGLHIQVQGRFSRTQVYGQISAFVDARTVDFDSATTLTGNINSTGPTLVYAESGAKTKFTTELGVGDVLAVGTQRATVTAVTTSAVTVTPNFTVASGVTVYVIVSLATSEPVTSTMRRFSLSRASQEIVDVVSVQLLADAVTWQFNLLAATAKSHGLQSLDVSPTVQIIPGTLTAFPTPTTSVKPRVAVDVVPPGTTLLRAEFDDPSAPPLLVPLVSLAGGTLVIGDDELAYTSASSSGTGMTFTLASPGTPRAYTAGVQVCALTTAAVTDLILSLVPELTWDLPFENWLRDLERQLKLFNARLCRVLQGRPEDIGQVAALMAAGAASAALSIGAMQITLGALLAGMEGLEALDKLIASADGAGMVRLSLSLKSGDVKAVAQMKASASTANGEMLQRVVAYRSKITTYGPALKADRLADQLRGNETSVRVLGETRAGFNKAAASDIKRRREAARRQKQEAKEVTR